jgi:hypothetical protein
MCFLLECDYVFPIRKNVIMCFLLECVFVFPIRMCSRTRMCSHTGDLLRAERDSGSEQGEMINTYMKEVRMCACRERER